MMNEKNFKRVTVLLLAFMFVCIYVNSHVNNDYKMIRIIAKQKEEIKYLKSYVKILETGKTGSWQRCK